MRNTKIVCTIGPSCESPDRMRELILAGMNVARFNFSHGTHEEQEKKFQTLVEVREELKMPVATLLDTKGPEIRLRDFVNGKEELKSGQIFVLTTEDVKGTNERVSISYQDLPKDLSEGASVLIDDGLIEMKAEKITETDIVCRVINGGVVSNKKGVNVPQANLSMPYIGKADYEDIIFGIEKEFDFLAASFVRSKEDIWDVRKILEEHGSKMKIIAKIENMQGINNLDEILDASDGIMVARGDMGVEVPLEEVPPVQKMMIKKAVEKGKHVITATQMLESMTKNPRPTRAETADVANAIYDGTTAIMLSGETASGLYPVESVKTMAKIAQRTEQDIDYAGRLMKLDRGKGFDITTAISHATCTTAADLKASAIITVTMSGFTAGMISRYKPNCKMIVCSVEPRVCRQSNLLWGALPLQIEKQDTTEALFMGAIRAAKDAGYVKEGDVVVLTAGVPLGVAGNTNMIRVVEL